MMIAVNGNVDAASLTTSVRGAIAAVDPALAVAKVTTMAEVVSEASAPQRFSATVLAGFAAGALLLAGIGLYGVLAFGVTQRTREIGVRLALGASRAEVLGLVVRQGMVLAGVGLAIGLAGALAASRVLRALLFETNVYDPGDVRDRARAAGGGLAGGLLPAGAAGLARRPDGRAPNRIG